MLFIAPSWPPCAKSEHAPHHDRNNNSNNDNSRHNRNKYNKSESFAKFKRAVRTPRGNTSQSLECAAYDFLWQARLDSWLFNYAFDCNWRQLLSDLQSSIAALLVTPTSLGMLNYRFASETVTLTKSQRNIRRISIRV